MGSILLDRLADMLDEYNVSAEAGGVILDVARSAIVGEKLILPLEYETDNRDETVTWLQVSMKGVYLGYIPLTVKEMFGLIQNVMENSEGMDTSEIENGIDSLKEKVYPGKEIPGLDRTPGGIDT